MVEPTTSASLDGYPSFPEERVREYREQGYWRDLALHEVLDRTADTYPDKSFVDGPQGHLTYSEAVDRTTRIAAYLLGELGLDPRDRVVIQLTNRIEFLELFFGCSRAGVIPVILLPRHRRAEAIHIADLTDARGFVTLGPDTDSDFDYVGMVDDLATEVTTLDHRIAAGDRDTDGEDRATDLPDGWIDYSALTGTDWTEVHGGELADVTVDPTDPGLMLLSGGTTGMPKVIPRTHNEYVFQWNRWEGAVGITADWTGMPWVPIGHNASLNPIIGAAVTQGASIVLEPVLKAATLVDRVLSAGVNYFFAVPTQLVDLLEHERVDDLDLTDVSVIVTGGQKVRPRIAREIHDRWDIDIANNYGMAEGPLFSTRPSDDIDTQAETVGRPIAPDADEYRIVDEERDGEVSRGMPGELSARGPGIFSGYLRNEEENEAAFDEEGWFYTEDVLEVGDDGNYRVHGRLKDTIIRGGENIYAPGVEDELIEHPKIQNVAVIGMPDERLGQRPMAYVELEAGVESLTLREVVDFLDDRGMAVFKRPERLEIVESLPLTEVGKIDKAELRNRITDELRAEEELDGGR